MSLSFKSKKDSNEELLIRALVDDIYQIEEKINSINDQINKNEVQNISIKKIEELKTCRNNLIQKKIKLNDSLISEMKNNSDLIQQKLNLIKNIDDNLTLMKNELISNFNTLSFKSMKLKKCILSNKSNDFLSEHQINDIILEPIKSSKNSDIQKLRREIAVNKASETVIINNYKEINSKIAQIEENLKMLKEEKMTTKLELINLISCKESLESIIKLNINQLNIHNKLNNENEEKNKEEEDINLQSHNNWTKPSELYVYELMVIDPEKAANSICNQLFTVFNIKNLEENNNEIGARAKNRNNKNNKTFNSYKTVDNNYTSYNNNYVNQNKSLNELSHYKLKNNDNNDSFNNYNNIYLKYNYMSINSNNSNIIPILDEKNVIDFIQNELDKFISGEIYSYKTIYEFIENLSIIIISKFQYANIIIPADALTIYLSYSFKSLYYDSIINSKVKFINKDYKTIKKNYKNLIPYLKAESSKLDTKYHEYKSKIQIIEKQIKLMQKGNIKKNNIKEQEKINLSSEEQNYIQICSKANGLIKQKKNIQKIINDYENKKNELIKDNELMVNKLNDEIKNIDKEIVKINKDMKTEKNKLNKDIDYYKKLINEKYNIIKEQLQIYKDKYGSNLDIYNRLINSINNTIKRSHTKQPLIIINNNNNINNSNIFSYDINKKQNDIELNNENNIKELFLFPNENLINNEFNEEIIDNNNIKKDLFNIGIDISRIEKDGYSPNFKKEISNLSINNNSIDNKRMKPITIREQNIRKIIEIRRANKGLSNVDNAYKVHNYIPSFEYLNEINKLNNKNNSITTDIKDSKNKTFYNSSISGNISNKKIFKEKNKSLNQNTSSISVNDNNINYASERRYDKYSKYYNNYYKKNSKILTYNNSNNNSTNKHKYQSYSFMNKSTKKISESNSSNKLNDSNFHNSITKKKMGLLKYKEEKIPKSNLNNTINNNSINFLNTKELNKLTNTLQSLKDTITHRGRIPYQSYNFNINGNIQNKQKFLEKIQFLKNSTFCYYREYNNNLHKYNPLLEVSGDYLCQMPYFFIPAYISLNQEGNQISIIPTSEELNKIDLNINDIENTIVSSKIKLIIEVHRNFRKYKESSKFKSIEDFVEKQINKNPQLTWDEIEKCAKNKNFNFSILINGGKLIELIICSYEEFKQWINGLAYLIKNKNEIF